MPYFFKITLIRLLRALLDLVGPIVGPKRCYVDEVKDFALGDAKLRVYRNDSFPRNKRVIIYYHGGGWTLGSIKAYDPILRYISTKSESTLVAVEYGKAPEVKFPKQIYESIDAFNWAITEFGDDCRVVVAGDSAGGNIASIVLGNVSDDNSNIVGQALIYPVVELNYDSIKQMRRDTNFLVRGVGFYLLTLFVRCYLGSISKIRSKYFLMPARYTMPRKIPTLIISAGIDPLKYCAFQKVRRLKEEGCNVMHHHYKSSIHGFVQFYRMSRNSRDALSKVIGFIRSL